MNKKKSIGKTGEDIAANYLEKLGFKIREARLDKVPYMLILGEKEQAAGMVSVRQRDAEADKQDMGQMLIEEFVKILKR